MSSSLYEKYKYQIGLHVAVLIFGTTGVLGKLITLDAYHLVWHRLWMASLCIGLFFLAIRHSVRIDRARLVKILGAGVVLAAHWFTFFEAIKRSNVSVALVCFSSCSLFASVLEPLYYKRRIAWHECFFGLCVVVGLYFVFRSEFKFVSGMLYSVASAALAAWFTVLNGLLVRESDARTIAFYELLGALGAASVYLLATDSFDAGQMALSGADLGWLLVLAILCTAFTFILSIQLVKRITPYTFVMAVNLEPIYSILMAYLIWPESETMSGGFYLGGVIVVAMIFLNALVKRRFQKAASLVSGNALPETAG